MLSLQVEIIMALPRSNETLETWSGCPLDAKGPFDSFYATRPLLSRKNSFPAGAQTG